jgi:hypothetical protein
MKGGGNKEPDRKEVIKMQLKDYGKKTREVIKCQPGWYRGADIWLTRTKRGGIRLYVYNGRYMDASLEDIDPATLSQADVAEINKYIR